ncbi:Tyrocidine synthase 3, partial [Exaiptasia diaphana]
MDDSQEKIHGALNFATALYDKSTVERMTQHYLFILEQIVESAGKALKDYSLLNASDYQQIVLDWNQSSTDYPKDKTIHQLFEEQVELYPDNIAVSFEDQQLTYVELNEKSNQLARYIQSKAEIQPDTLIALCLDRSPEMIVSILGVLKSGAAYVPISPEYPKDRIEYIAEDANALLMITQSHLLDVLQDIDLPTTIEIDRIQLGELDASDLQSVSTSSDLAYVIYTSGTTGKPKGVLQTHGNVQRLFSCTDHQFNFSEKDVWTL